MNLYKRIFIYSFSISAGLLLLLLGACTSYHYEYPQPVDVKNTYQFPKSFRGTWKDVTEKEGLNKFTVTIGKDFLSLSVKPSKVYNGLLDSAGRVKHIPFKKIKYDSLNQPIDTVDDVITKNFEGLRHIVYDEQKLPIDTVEDYIINGNKIYPMTGDDTHKMPHPGFPFTIKDDTIYLDGSDKSRETRLSLSADNFLRKISKDRYVLNLREGDFQSVRANDGLGLSWQIVLLEFSPEGFLCMGTPKYSQQKDKLSIVYQKNDDYYYLNNQWTVEQFIKIVENENFSTEPIFKLERKKYKSKLNWLPPAPIE